MITKKMGLSRIKY